VPKARVATFWSVHISAWCETVKVKPDLNRTSVFKKGNSMWSRGLIKRGGHSPNSNEGLRLVWKKLQKKETKK